MSDSLRTQVIAYEGYRHPQATASWGVAALRIGDVVRNAATGAEMPYVEAEIQNLVATGALTLLPQPVAFEEEKNAIPIVLEIASRHVKDAHLLDLGAPAAEIADEETTWWVFRKKSLFDRFARSAATRLAHLAFYGAGFPSTAALEMIRAGLVFEPNQLELNAARAAFAAWEARENAERAESIVKLAALRLDEAQRDDFRDICHGMILMLQRPDDQAESDKDSGFYFPGGIATDGGLDADKLRELLGNLETARSWTKHIVPDTFPSISESPSPRFHHSEAASAKLFFRANLPSRPFGERVARYLDLVNLRKALDGELTNKRKKTETIENAIRHIQKPDESLELQVRPLGESNYRKVRVDAPPPRAAPKVEKFSEPLFVLGYQSGQYREGENLELVIQTSYPVSVSATRNRDKREPEGAAKLRDSAAYTFRPARIELVRERMSAGKQRFHLQSVSFFDESNDDLVVTAIPSAIVRGAFLYGLEIKIAFREKQLYIGRELLADVSGRTRRPARTWMKAYDAWAAERELVSPDASRLAPTGKRAIDPVVRIASALFENDGTTPLATLVRAVGANSTLGVVRTLMGNGTLFEFDDDGVRLKERGRQLAVAFRAIKNRWV